MDAQTEVTLPLLRKVQEQGFAVDNEETEIGARCLAAPIFNVHGRPIAAISISGPVNYMKPRMCTQTARALKESTYRISNQLGFTAKN